MAASISEYADGAEEAFEQEKLITIAQEETFGPVIAMMKVETMDEAMSCRHRLAV